MMPTVEQPNQLPPSPRPRLPHPAPPSPPIGPPGDPIRPVSLPQPNPPGWNQATAVPARRFYAPLYGVYRYVRPCLLFATYAVAV